jgi:RNA-binding protein YlmH
VGDIIIQGERGAHVLLVPEITEYVENELKQVRSVPVTCTRIALAELGVRPPVKKEVCVCVCVYVFVWFAIMFDRVNGGSIRCCGL